MSALLARLQALLAASPMGRIEHCPACLAPVEPAQASCAVCGNPVRGGFASTTGLRSPSVLAAVTLALVAVIATIGYIVLAPGPAASTSPLASVPDQKTPAPSATPSPGTTGSTGATGSTGVTGTTAVDATSVATPKPPKIPAVTPTPKPATAKSTTTTADKAPAGSPTPATAPAKTTTTAPAGTPTEPATVAPPTVPLTATALSSYNPYGAPKSSFGSPAKAIDGDPLTSWTYQLDPSTNGATLVGLAVNLKPAREVSAIAITTTTPGMSVEFYGTTGALPPLITDPGWVHLASRPSIDAQATVALKATGKAFDYLLVWITHAPPGVNTGTLTISELSIAG